MLTEAFSANSLDRCHAQIADPVHRIVYPLDLLATQQNLYKTFDTLYCLRPINKPLKDHQMICHLKVGRARRGVGYRYVLCEKY